VAGPAAYSLSRTPLAPDHDDLTGSPDSSESGVQEGIVIGAKGVRSRR